MQVRQTYKALGAQSNIEAIANAAVEQLPPDVSDEPVDEDWRTRFFNIAEDISSDEMHQFWGKILAGEVAKPGSFSLRTLEVLRNLTQKEAEIFQKIRQFSTDTGNILKPSKVSSGLDDFGIIYREILILREAGLLMDGDNLNVTAMLPAGQSHVGIGFNGKCLIFVPVKNRTSVKLEQIQLTSSGRELLTLIQPVINIHYLNKLADYLAQSNIVTKFGNLDAPLDTYRTIGNTTD